MYCNQCGTKLPDDAKFCQNCGAAAHAEQPPEQHIPSGKAKNSGKSGKKLAVGIAAVVVLLLLVPLAGQILFGGPTEDPMGSSDPGSPVQQGEDTPSGGGAGGDPVSSETTEPAYAPDPEFFFNTGAAEKGDNSMTLVLSETPGDAVFAYLSVLKNSYGMTQVDSYTETEAWQWRLQKGGDENATVTVGLDKRGDGDWDLSFIFGENVTLVQAETQSGGDGIPDPEPTPTPESTPEPTPEPAPEPEVTDPSVLPDFLAHDSSGKFEMLSESRTGEALYKADSDQLKYVAEDYMDLLAEMGYTVVYEYDNEHTSSTTTIRDLYHSGVDAGAVLDDSEGQVRVHINTYTRWNETDVAIFYSDGITMENFDGGSGSGGGSDDDFFDECDWCDGSGKCGTCGGSGDDRKFQAGLGWVEQNCFDCGGTGRCDWCNGTGDA